MVRRSVLKKLNEELESAICNHKVSDGISIRTQVLNKGLKGFFIKRFVKKFDILSNSLDELIIKTKDIYLSKLNYYERIVDNQDIVQAQQCYDELLDIQVSCKGVFPELDIKLDDIHKLASRIIYTLDRIDSFMSKIGEGFNLDEKLDAIYTLDSLRFTANNQNIKYDWGYYDLSREKIFLEKETIIKKFHQKVQSFIDTLPDFESGIKNASLLEQLKQLNEECNAILSDNHFLSKTSDATLLDKAASSLQHLTMGYIERKRKESLRKAFYKRISDLQDNLVQENLTECEIILGELNALLTNESFLVKTPKYKILERLLKKYNEFREVEQKRKELAAIALLNTLLDKGNIEKARLELRHYENVLSSDSVATINNRIAQTKEQYNSPEGLVVSDNEAIVRVDYLGKWYAKNPLDYEYYPGIFYPHKGTIIFPYRRRRIGRRGYTEEEFQLYLQRYLADTEVLGDVSIHLADFCNPYEPDIVVIYKNIRIDIEIDEPYSGYKRNPIHYIGCGDESRDLLLTRAGWIVVRFAEIDIVWNREECIHRIYKIINSIDPQYNPTSLPSFDGKFHKRRRWSKNEAQIMSIYNEREDYLGIESFGKTEDAAIGLMNRRMQMEIYRRHRKIDNFMTEEDTLSIDVVQTEFERQLSKRILPIRIINRNISNFDNSNKQFEQDSHLSFFRKDHKYYYDNFIVLKPVSDIVSLFFPQFDAVSVAKRKAEREECEPEDFLIEWDRIGAESREVGSFMHIQIENILKGKDVETDYIFNYRNNKPKIISIAKELQYFRSFMKNNRIVPFRTEWPICDIRHRIAGTIDCICKSNSGYVIIDWKRTTKVLKYDGDVIETNDWGETAFNKLSHLEDCRYNHYALQLNLYRYILTQYYNLNVSAMFIVVLHSFYDSYQIVQVPKMDKEVRIMLNDFPKLH